jgi:hypothetical protein
MQIGPRATKVMTKKGFVSKLEKTGFDQGGFDE